MSDPAIQEFTAREPKRNIIPFFSLSILFIIVCTWGGFWGYIGSHPIPIRQGTQSLPALELPAGGFILLFLSTWVLGLLLFFFFPKGISQKAGVILILGLSLASRVALLPHEYSDDLNRYLWEGKLIRSGISPYIHAPDSPVLSELAAADPFHAHINHPDLPAAYPPLMLFLFSILGAVWYSPMAVKWLVLLFDMGTVFFIIKLLQARGINMRWSLLYALSPVILYAFSGQGHFDAIQNFWIAGSLFCFDQKKWLPMFLLAGIGVQTKYVAALAVPFLVNRANYRFVLVALAAAVIPFFPVPDTGLGDFFFSLQKFGEEYAVNGSIHGILRVISGGIPPATTICQIIACILLVTGILLFHPETDSRYHGDPLSGIFFSFGVVLLLLPTVHFWYLGWVLLFLPFRPSGAWIVLCAGMAFYFVSSGRLYQTGIWELPVWAQIVIWLPFYLILLREAYLFAIRGRSRLDNKPVQSLSVVIPAKNEEDGIVACIRSIRSDPCVKEVIVVDGGSSDQTTVRAEEAGAVVISHDKPPSRGGGRGGQICRGIKQATGDCIAIVHADVQVSPHTFSDICRMLEKNPTVIGGAVGGVFDGSDRWLRVVEWLNDLRALFFSISFGDQIQFFRRQPITGKQVFPDIPLMEDVELSLRLKHMGRQTYLFGTASISSRRWKAVGIQNGFSVARRLITYLMERKNGLPDTVSLYYRYYQDQGKNKASHGKTA